MVITSEDCAHAVLDAVPVIMRYIRTDMRSHRSEGLSVPQFRALVYLSQHKDSPLSHLAEHLGIRAPSASVMVEGLVSRDLVARRMHPKDRRRVALALTMAGQAAMEAAHRSTEGRLAERLAELDEPERAAVVQAMQAMLAVFDSTHRVEGTVGA
jgi:DNA-binding MarR family transcriptional regulator